MHIYTATRCLAERKHDESVSFVGDDDYNDDACIFRALPAIYRRGVQRHVIKKNTLNLHKLHCLLASFDILRCQLLCGVDLNRDKICLFMV